MNKILIICGPTATGKTKFSLTIAEKFNGELVSADSRQVYVGKNIVTGKDLPPDLGPQTSIINWRDRYLKYYDLNGIRVWLYDIVNPDDKFNVSFWRECADLVINDITGRNKLPIVVGGSGLFIKSLTQDLTQITIPPNEILRGQLSEKSAKYLFNYLNKIDSFKAASLNISDRNNPRRLIRSIEISQASPKVSLKKITADYLQIGLTASNTDLYQLINRRVLSRIQAGAALEDKIIAGNPESWQNHEHLLARHQQTWFRKQPHINWFDISSQNWQIKAELLIADWYNK